MADSKRDILVRRAVKVLNREGYRAAGIDKLVEQTGVSKMTVYKHFRSKDDLIVAALKLQDEEFRNRFIRAVEKAAKTPKGRLLALFDAMGEWVTARGFRGCMFIKAAAEYQDPDHPVNRACAEHKRLMLDYITGLAREAGAKHPQALAAQLFLLMEGETVAAPVLGKKKAVANAKQAARALIEKALG